MNTHRKNDEPEKSSTSEPPKTEMSQDNSEVYYDGNRFDTLKALVDLVLEAYHEKIEVDSEEWTEALREMPVDPAVEFSDIKATQVRLLGLVRKRLDNNSRIEQVHWLVCRAVEQLVDIHKPQHHGRTADGRTI